MGGLPSVRAALMGVVLVLSGCSAATEQEVQRPAASPTSSSTPPASTPASPSWPSPVAYGPVTLVTGGDVFSLDEGEVTTDADGTVHSRGAYRSTLSCDDERVAGTMVATWNTTRWDDNGALVQWGKARITNSGGKWVGRYTGVYTAKTYDMLTWWFTGRGAYDGLSMYMWEETSGGTEGTFRALVFPGRPPPA